MEPRKVRNVAAANGAKRARACRRDHIARRQWIPTCRLGKAAIPRVGLNAVVAWLRPMNINSGMGILLSSFAGLSRRSPVVSFCMMIFMLSLAGIPPLAGFFGKFYVFAAAVKTGAPNLGLLWLVILAIAMSAVSLYYYLQVLKQIYVADAPTGASKLRVPVLSQVVLGLLAAAVILFGCAPNLLVGVLQDCIKAAGL